MITDVPASDDFLQQGIAFLNLAWGGAFNLVLQLENAQSWNGLDDVEVSDDYWKAAKHPLATSLGLVHQGTDFLVKSKIVEVSPYLLIVGKPSDWPKGGATNDISFSAFHTVDAQDLIRVHNTVTARLPESFREQFEELRGLRNKITHTVDKNLLVTVKQITLAVLVAVNALIKPRAWTSLRRTWLHEEPQAVAFSADAADYELCREMRHVLKLLTPTELQEFLGFEKEGRAYLCPACSYQGDIDEDFTIASAKLKPNKPTSKSVFCFVCGENHEVVRQKCPSCKGNVLAKDWDMRCLSCGETP